MTGDQRVTKLVLASASPRRSELLRGLGLTFTVVPADVDESVAPGETAPQLVARLSAAKAAVVAATHPEDLVIAADTTVVIDGEVINKPAGEEENRAYIARLAGREHEVYTGHAVRLGEHDENVVVRMLVRFRQLTAAEIERYRHALSTELDPVTRALLEEILEVELQHASELGGKWTVA